MPAKKTAAEHSVKELAAINAGLQVNVDVMQERLAELELSIENQGWMRSGGEVWDFNRSFLVRYVNYARLMFMKNPLINRGVWVQTFYVWALGWSVDCVDDKVLKVINAYMTDPKNATLFTQNSLFDLENTRQVTGNLFFVHFTNKTTGRVRTRRVDFEEVTDIIYNPQDRTEPWFYVRTMNGINGRTETAVYPDINYNPTNHAIDPLIMMKWPANVAVSWNDPMSSHKTGGFGTMKYGMPEVFAALDWAAGYKQFLEDWATLMRAYARIAMKMSGNNKKDIPGAKSKLEVGRAGNMASNTASGGWMVSSGGVELSAVKTSGSTTSAEEGYSIKLMVAAAMGIPGTFFGDADVGNFATSATLDRPTELKMVARQGLWRSDLISVFSYVVLQAAQCPAGKLSLAGYDVEEFVDEVEKVLYYHVVSPDGKPDDADIRTQINIDFPSILERNVTERVRGVIGALTLNGNLPTDVLPDRKFMARTLLDALGLDPAQVRAELNEMFPTGSTVPPILPPPPPSGPFGGGAPTEVKTKPANKGRVGPAGGSKTTK